MKSTEVRFAILKNLALGPGHGYDLYMLLKDEFEIKNASELYKVLRGMKDELLVQQASVETTGGREREILELTPRGFEVYYQELLKASKNFLDLIAETAVRRLGEGIVKRLQELNLAALFENIESVFVHLSIPIERQLQLINQVSRYLTKDPVFYIQPSPSEYANLDYVKTSPRIRILDRNVTIKPGTIDLIVLFGPILDSMFDTTLADNPLVLLKPDGIMIAATLRENLRAITPGLLEGIRNVFKDLFEEAVGEKLLDSFSRLLMSSLFYDHFVSNKDIQAFLATRFEKVTPLGPAMTKLAPLFDAFIAQKLKDLNLI
jgi:DNA-binding PadR family transcriptional regulator